MKITHLNLTDDLRTLAVMRSAQQRLSLTEYISRLVVADATTAGLTDYLDQSSPGEQGAGEVAANSDVGAS